MALSIAQMARISQLRFQAIERQLKFPDRFSDAILTIYLGARIAC
jgi:hypothetical protein